MEQATRRPWRWEDRPQLEGENIIFHEHVLLRNDDEPVLYHSAGWKIEPANAALIVRAVNRDHLFERMVEALRRIVDAVDSEAHRGYCKNTACRLCEARAILKQLEEEK